MYPSINVYPSINLSTYPPIPPLNLSISSQFSLSEGGCNLGGDRGGHGEDGHDAEEDQGQLPPVQEGDHYAIKNAC